MGQTTTRITGRGKPPSPAGRGQKPKTTTNGGRSTKAQHGEKHRVEQGKRVHDENHQHQACSDTHARARERNEIRPHPATNSAVGQPLGTRASGEGHTPSHRGSEEGMVARYCPPPTRGQPQCSEST